MSLACNAKIGTSPIRRGRHSERVRAIATGLESASSASSPHADGGLKNPDRQPSPRARAADPCVSPAPELSPPALALNDAL